MRSETDGQYAQIQKELQDSRSVNQRIQESLVKENQKFHGDISKKYVSF